MVLNIAETLRSLRRDMGVTQEELANAIGVTAQAVSKWERGEGYPDITLLPDMAAYFRVTLDTLCGIDEQKKQRKIHDILYETEHADYTEGVNIAREGLAEFPHSVQLKANLARALMGCTAGWTPPRGVLKEVIGIYALFDEDRDWPLGMVFSYQLHLQVAVLSMESGEAREALVALDQAAELAVRIDSLPGDGYPSSLLLNRISFRYLSGGTGDRAWLREEIEGSAVFEPLRKIPAYERVMAKLT